MTYMVLLKFYCCTFVRSEKELIGKCKNVGYLHNMDTHMWLMPANYINAYNIKKIILSKSPTRNNIPRNIFFLDKSEALSLYKEYLKL